jgi:aminomethyltransferase
MVLDGAGNEIGIVLTCATDMGIGYYEGKIFSIASPDKPNHFEPKGLCCGFVKVNNRLSFGDTLVLKDKRRKINVTVVEDVRPHRTARNAMRDMI